MIDTHCHIYLKDFREDLEAVLNRAAQAGVSQILMPSIDLDSPESMHTLHHPDITFYPMIGIHPCEVNSITPKLESQLAEMAKKPEFIAIGETGLDYYWSEEFISGQKRSLNMHCEISKVENKPVILHNRNSTDDLLNIIEKQQDGRLSGIWHCFNGTVDQGKRAIDLNLHLGIGGVLTFKNAGVDQTVASLPLSRMLLETDAPYLAPHPKRGKRNEPAFIQYTAKRLAEIMNCSLDAIIEQTTLNTLELFNLQE